MKKPLLFGILFAVCILVVGIIIAQVYPVGMISYWKFDEGVGYVAYDSVNENHGIIYMATRTTGIVGGALSFNEAGDCAEVDYPEANLNITEKLTLEAWINPRDVLEGNIISKQSEECTPYQLSVDSQWGIQFQCSSDSLDPNAWYGITSAGGIINKDEWQHVALTFDSGTMKLYYNGEIKKTESGPSEELPSCQTSVFFGRTFNGSIDEVAIYNRVLTPEEIWQHYVNGLEGKGYGLEDTIETLIINIEDLDLPKGIENSVASKLENALSSLEKENYNAAFNQLNAFINVVEAQKGKKLTEEQADELIAAADVVMGWIEGR